MIDFSTLKGLTIPEGNVTELAIDGVTVWKKEVGVPINTLAVGSSVFMNVDGVRTEFLVVHQGLPSTHYYDESCDGTWLLMKDIYEQRIFDTNWDVDYPDTDMHIYLNSTFLDKIDSKVRNIIQPAKIPVLSISDINEYAANACKIFLLSVSEVQASYTDADLGVGEDWCPVHGEGWSLEFFKSKSPSINIAYFNGVANHWWLRTPYMEYEDDYDKFCMVNCYGYGDHDYKLHGGAQGIRPALILPSETLVNGSFDVIA